MSSFASDFSRLVTLQDANTRVVMLGVGVLGLACGVSGAFAVLRRRALVGDAVAHASLPGVCLAYLVVGERSLPAMLLGALVFGVLAAAALAWTRRATRVKDDATLAIIIGSLFGLGVALSRIIQARPGGDKAGLDGFIFGKAASMVRADAALVVGVCLAVLGVVALLYKEFKLLSFDRDYAACLGRPVVVLDLALTGLVCVCTVVGLPAVGVVLIVALLIIPAVAARMWSDRLHVVLLLAGAIGALSGVVGVALSATLPAPAAGLSRGWPTGPVVVLVAASIFVISMAFSPRGLLTGALRRRRDRLDVAAGREGRA